MLLASLSKVGREIPGRLGERLAARSKLLLVLDGRHVCGESGDEVSGSLGDPGERIVVEVVDGIAKLVVAAVVRNADLTTEELDFTLGLESTGAGVDTTSDDAGVDEGSVVGACGEGAGNVVELAAVKVFLSEALESSRADSRGNTSVGTSRVVTIVNTEHVVRASKHVEVDVQRDLVALRLGELLDVVPASNQPDLLSRPPRETDGVLRLLEARELLEELGNGSGTGAIVVDTRAGGDGVEMRTDEDDVVLVAPLTLSDDVVGGPDLVDHLNIQRRFEGLASSELSYECLSVVLGETDGGRVGRDGVDVETRAKGAAGDIVVDDQACDAGLTGQVALLDECAVASGYQGDGAGGAFELLRKTAEAWDGEERSGDALCRGAAGVLVRADSVLGVVDAIGGEGVGDDLGRRVDDGLAGDFVAVGLGPLLDVLDGSIVTRGSEGARVSSVDRSELRERLGVLKKTFDSDGVLVSLARQLGLQEIREPPPRRWVEDSTEVNACDPGGSLRRRCIGGGSRKGGN